MRAKELLRALESGAFDGRLRAVYGERASRASNPW